MPMKRVLFMVRRDRTTARRCVHISSRLAECGVKSVFVEIPPGANGIIRQTMQETGRKHDCEILQYEQVAGNTIWGGVTQRLRRFFIRHNSASKNNVAKSLPSKGQAKGKDLFKFTNDDRISFSSIGEMDIDQLIDVLGFDADAIIQTDIGLLDEKAKKYIRQAKLVISRTNPSAVVVDVEDAQAVALLSRCKEMKIPTFLLHHAHGASVQYENLPLFADYHFA